MSTENALRYLKVDYQSHKDALLQRVRARWPNNWNDFLANSFGIVLVDVVAWSTATLAFMVNRVAGENYVSTMTLRESAVRLGGLVGYKLRGPVPASVACEASLSSAQSAAVTIRKGTLVRTSDSLALPFEVARDYTIAAGDLSPETEIASFSPELSGANVINSFVIVTSGLSSADLVDSTVDLSTYIEAGQSFRVDGSADVYTIQSLETAPGAVADFTRMVLDRPFDGDTATVAASVFDTRIALSQGQTVTDRFVSASSAAPNFTVKLSRTPVIDNSVAVSVNGELWSQVSSTDVWDADSTVYQVKTFVSGQTVVVFGDGRFGREIPAEAAIEVVYRVGGGASGNIAMNTINTTVTGLITSLSSPVPVVLVNATSVGSGGREAESLEEARTNIPHYTRTNDRAVTLADYQTIAQQFSDPTYGSVAYARSAVRTENSFLEGNVVTIYAWTTGPDSTLVPLSSPLKLALKTYLQTKAVGTDLVEIYDGTARPVPVSLRFRVFGGFAVADTSSLLSDTLRSFIAALRPGDVVEYSNLLRTLDEVQGVDTISMATPLGDMIPSSSMELFTPPQDDYVYDIPRTGFGSPVTDSNGDSISNYSASMPVFPIQVWSMRLFMGVNELSIVPHTVPGFARLFGQNISNDDDYPSTANLLTGAMSLWIEGAPGDLTAQLVTIQGYSADRVLNVYIGYTGENTVTKRREIRSALRSWSDGLSIGGAVYARRVSGIAASRVSITDVVESIDGVDAVTRVAVGTPASNDSRVTTADFELPRLGNIVINNSND